MLEESVVRRKRNFRFMKKYLLCNPSSKVNLFFVVVDHIWMCYSTKKKDD